MQSKERSTRGADPRSNFDRRSNIGTYNRFNNGALNYGNSYFPDQWYYQNRPFISPDGGFYRNTSDRNYYTR